MKLQIRDLISPNYRFTQGGIYELIISDDIRKSYNYLLNDLKIFTR